VVRERVKGVESHIGDSKTKLVEGEENTGSEREGLRSNKGLEFLRRTGVV